MFFSAEGRYFVVSSIQPWKMIRIFSTLIFFFLKQAKNKKG